MLQIVFLSCALLAYLPFGQSYPRGAPAKACSHMFPVGHPGDAQDPMTSPFTIKLYSDSYYPGSNVSVTIEANSGVSYKGFFLQARKADCIYEDAVGHFYHTGDPQVKMMPCPEGSHMNNSVTHNSNEAKWSKTFIWMNKDGGDVFFQATVVQNAYTYWAGMQSPILKDVSRDSSEWYDHCPAVTRREDFMVTAAASRSGISFLFLFGLLPLVKYL